MSTVGAISCEEVIRKVAYTIGRKEAVPLEHPRRIGFEQNVT